MGDIAEARSCFEESLKQKFNLRSCVHLAQIEIEDGNLIAAKAVLEKGLSLVPITRPEKEEREKLNQRIQALQMRL